MSPTQPVSAVEWAEAVSGDDPVSLGELEAHTFRRHRRILTRLGPEGTKLAATIPRSGRGQNSFWLWMLIGFVIVGMPVVGFAFVWDSPFNPETIEAATGVPVAGVCFGVAAVIQVGSFVRWLSRGRRRSGAMLWSGVLAAVMGVMTMPTLLGAAARDGYAGGQPWAVVVVIGAALGAIVALLQVIASHRVTEADEREALIAALPAQEGESLERERSRAIEVLARRGLLDDAAAELACSAPLGTLAEGASTAEP